MSLGVILQGGAVRVVSRHNFGVLGRLTTRCLCHLQDLGMRDGQMDCSPTTTQEWPQRWGRTVRCARAVPKVGCSPAPVATGPRVLNSAPPVLFLNGSGTLL